MSVRRVRAADGSVTRHDSSPTPTSHSDILALDALAEALLPRLLPKIRAALAAELNADGKLITPRDTPTPRATTEACRRGAIAGARKVHRKWMFTTAAWRDYVERGRAPQRPGRVDADDVEAAALELRRELGLAHRGGRRCGG
jgi:hypothetical protein